VTARVAVALGSWTEPQQRILDALIERRLNIIGYSTIMFVDFEHSL